MLHGHDETALAERSDGTLLAFMRAEGAKTHALELSESRDGGQSWSEPRRLLQPGQWPFDAARLSSGRLLLVFGERRGPYGVRALVSDDGGKTWDDKRQHLLALDCQNSDCGYPSTVQLDDGTVVTIYYAVGTAALPHIEQAISVRYTEKQLLAAMGR